MHYTEKNVNKAKESNLTNTPDCESVINVEGTPFTKEVLKELKQWITPSNGFSESTINLDIDSLSDVESFIFDNYDATIEDEKDVLYLLSFIHRLKERLKELANVNLFVEKGGLL
jgi:hypothetical protein